LLPDETKKSTEARSATRTAADEERPAQNTVFDGAQNALTDLRDESVACWCDVCGVVESGEVLR
ncbi:MAG TPA: hypothetical protein VHN36_20985, partial [Ilumatobacteraceae bacterium]|nr:hypothetical protein [Ilumatobacteraceae bacterium]